VVTVLLRVLVALALLSTLAACNPSRDSASVGGGDVSAASSVALKYATDLFDGQVDRARELVEPASQSTFRLVAAGISQQRLKANGLGVGRTQVTGDEATTTLVGDLCRVDPTGAGSPSDCISNRDPYSANPIFTVATARQPDGSWRVTLTVKAEAGTAEDSSSSPGATSSAGADS
jgi:hypothetical protein